VQHLEAVDAVLGVVEALAADDEQAVAPEAAS